MGPQTLCRTEVWGLLAPGSLGTGLGYVFGLQATALTRRPPCDFKHIGTRAVLVTLT